MGNIVKKLYSKVNLDTYRNIQLAFLASGVSISLINVILLIHGIDISMLMHILTGTSFSGYYYSSFIEGNKYTKDMMEIKGLYSEFLKNYDKLNKVFDFNDPVSVSVLFHFLVYNGFLSKDKEFEFNGDKSIELPTCLGVNVMNGYGVCRHISSMLTDILNEGNMPAANIGCFMREQTLEINELAFLDYSTDELISWVKRYYIDEKEKEEFIEKLKVLDRSRAYLDLDMSCDVDYDKILNRKRYGNHLITYCLNDGKSFYLDPTQDRIYRMNQQGYLHDIHDDKIILKDKSFRTFNDKDNALSYCLKDNMFIPGDTIDIEEESKIIYNTKDIIVKNMDVFDNFYIDNKELYGEISSKLVRIKKK